jgi:hypothetical protein
MWHISKFFHSRCKYFISFSLWCFYNPTQFDSKTLQTGPSPLQVWILSIMERLLYGEGWLTWLENMAKVASHFTFCATVSVPKILHYTLCGNMLMVKYTSFLKMIVYFLKVRKNTYILCQYFYSNIFHYSLNTL